MNDRPDLALDVGADGVHVGQDDASPALARRILGPDAIVGLSTHAPAELDASISELVDYVSAARSKRRRPNAAAPGPGPATSPTPWSGPAGRSSSPAGSPPPRSPVSPPPAPAASSSSGTSPSPLIRRGRPVSCAGPSIRRPDAADPDAGGEPSTGDGSGWKIPPWAGTGAKQRPRPDPGQDRGHPPSPRQRRHRGPAAPPPAPRSLPGAAPGRWRGRW